MKSATDSGLPAGSTRTKVIVATSVMLSFISFWRAAAIVLADLGSSAFYAGGIAEQAIGKAAPWFIFGVMLFSYAVRAVYVESCAMFTRGGVYRVVKESMGGTLAKLSVSALMFDYILTGPISGVSAGQYIIGLLAQTLTYFGHPWNPSKETVNHLAACICIVITIYFWWRNTKGIHESSEDALKIMYIASVMVVILLFWSGLTILTQPGKQRLPPAPTASHFSFNRDAVGWMPKLVPHAFESEKSAPASSNQPETAAVKPEGRFGIPAGAGALVGLIGILIAFGHSILAMSGEETLAQVNRELEYPKHKNLMRAGMVIFIYSLVFTSAVSFIAYAVIPDHIRSTYFDNMISGIAMNLAGPLPLKLLFQGFIVIVGFLMLAGAVNTAIIGSNAVLNRISEDGVLTDWFRAPHHKYGTSYRIINMIVLLQLATIILSRGEVYVLGEAYAFGVVWSFAFNALAMLRLRFKDKITREWRVPFNLKMAGKEIPLGLGGIAAILFSLAIANMITKQVATISGLLITAVFSTIFFISERINERRRKEGAHIQLDQFNLQPQEAIDTQTLQVKPNNTLCVVRDYTHLDHVRHALEKTHTGKTNLVVMTVHLLRGPNTGYRDLNQNKVFTDYEQLLFSRVVALAEKAGKHVDLLVVPSSNVYQAMALTAVQLQSANIIVGRSSVIEPEEQSRRMGEAWEKLPLMPETPVQFHIVESDGTWHDYYLGAHAPELSREEIDLVHQIWLELTHQPGYEKLHHKDIVSLALRRLQKELKQHAPAEVVSELEKSEHSY